MELLALHSRPVRQCMGTINQIRGSLIKHSITLRQRPVPLRKALVDILASDATEISPRIRRLLEHLAVDWQSNPIGSLSPASSSRGRHFARAHVSRWPSST